jgi:heat shock protein HtpX
VNTQVEQNFEKSISTYVIDSLNYPREAFTDKKREKFAKTFIEKHINAGVLSALQPLCSSALTLSDRSVIQQKEKGALKKDLSKYLMNTIIRQSLVSSDFKSLTNRIVVDIANQMVERNLINGSSLQAAIKLAEKNTKVGDVIKSFFKRMFRNEPLQQPQAFKPSRGWHVDDLLILAPFIPLILDFIPLLNNFGINTYSLAKIYTICGAFSFFTLNKCAELGSANDLSKTAASPGYYRDHKQDIALVHSLAKKAGLPTTPEVVICRDSWPSAFAYGSRGKAVLGIHSGMLNQFSRKQLRAVLGHELGHVVNNDFRNGILATITVVTSSMFLGQVLGYHSSNLLGLASSSANCASRVFFNTFFKSGFLLLGSIFYSRWGRYRESQADQFGAKLSDPNDLISVFKYFQRYEEIITPKTTLSRFKSLFESHPPTQERIERLQKMKSSASKKLISS